MSIESFLQRWGVVERTHDEPQAKAYGVTSIESGKITVYAPSGEEALRIAGADGMSIGREHERAYLACNHKGDGVYEIVVEAW